MLNSHTSNGYLLNDWAVDNNIYFKQGNNMTVLCHCWQFGKWMKGGKMGSEETTTGVWEVIGVVHGMMRRTELKWLSWGVLLKSGLVVDRTEWTLLINLKWVWGSSGSQEWYIVPDLEKSMAGWVSNWPRYFIFDSVLPSVGVRRTDSRVTLLGFESCL